MGKFLKALAGVFESFRPQDSLEPPESATPPVSADVGIRFDLSNDATLRFIARYPYRRAAKYSPTGPEDLREIMLASKSQGWPLRKTRDALVAKFPQLARETAETLALTESARADNAGALAEFRNCGTERKTWIADGASCPLCKMLDGKVVSINQPFLARGEIVKPPSAAAPIKMKCSVRFPPAHEGCCRAIGAEV